VKLCGYFLYLSSIANGWYEEMRVRAAIILLIILLLLSAYPLSTLGRSAAQSSQCTASQKLRMTLVVPPNSLSATTITTGGSGGILVGMLNWGTPLYLPNGSLDQFQAITDWVSHNSNYTQWTFNVKPGLKWSNGQNITANDILATFGPKWQFNSTYDFLLMGPEVQSEYALNSSAAVYVLNVSDAHWADKFNWDIVSPIYPASLVDSQGPATTNVGTAISNGPFYVSNYSSGEFQMTMLRNPYFNPQPKICEIDVNFVDSLSSTAIDIKSGATDLAPVEPSNAQSVLSSNIRLLDEKGLYVNALQYNDSVYPYNMTAFRQALAFGINQTDYINEAFNSYATTAYSAEGIVSPLATAWYNPNQMQYSFNQTESLALLSSVGITKGSDGFLHYPNGSVVNLALWTDTGNTQDPVGAAVIQKDLQQLGFKVALTTDSENTLIGDYTSNLNGIRSAMIMYTANPVVWGDPNLDILPGWDVYWGPTLANPYWEYPPNINNEYQSNYTAFEATGDMNQMHTYLDNVQALNAQYLPSLVLAYPDSLWAYNNQSFTNWPSGYMLYGGASMNMTALTYVSPVSPPSGLASSTLTLVVVAVVAIVVVVGVVSLLVLRRRRKP
jgi:peptide/nickel transport system substrate-binding protein